MSRVLHLMDRLMERQLDAHAARMLQTHVEAQRRDGPTSMPKQLPHLRRTSRVEGGRR